MGKRRSPRTPPSLRTWKFLEIGAGVDTRNLSPDTPDVPLPPSCEDSLAGLRGRPTRLGRTGAAGGTMVPHGAQPRREENEQDGGREGRGSGEGARQARPAGSARLRASPRTAEQLCSRLRLLRSAPPSPPPAARRPALPALPGPPPTELCRYHFRRERRARRRTPALCAGERKCSAAEPAGLNGRCPGVPRGL